MARSIHQPKNLRGAFAVGLNATFDDFKDGTSHTLLLAEIGGTYDRALRGQYATKQPNEIMENPSYLKRLIDSGKEREYAPTANLAPIGRGGCWSDGAAGISMVNTILPPDSPSGSLGDGPNFDGIYSAGSAHPAGINIALADASVHTIRRDIDCGDSALPTLTVEQMADSKTPSPYGLWGAMGTLATGDTYKRNW